MTYTIYILNGRNLNRLGKRDAVYHNTLVSKTATAVMTGFGTYGYLPALDWLKGRVGPA
jgi:3-dehydroquinate dehydratase